MSEQSLQQKPGLFMRAYDWLDERYQVRQLVNALLHVYIPRNAKTYYLGGVTMFLFIVQVITGSLLVLYYQPTPDTAYDSVLRITSTVYFGWLIRSIHAWGANFMIIFCMLHMLRVFIQGAYKPPREVTWNAGVILLLMTLAFGFTGYLLPWDQRAYWATVVGSESAGAIPVVGEQLLLFLRGGVDVTSATLTRFFGLHTIFLPVGLALLLGFHLVLIHQQGLANPDRPSTDIDDREFRKKSKTLPFFPHYAVSELIAWYAIIGLLIVLASIFPMGLEEEANPLETPPHIKPEWYFLALYQLLKLVPRTLGIIAPLLAVLALFFLPYLDRNKAIAPRKRRFAMSMMIATLAGLIIFTIWGWLS
ncbi:MAG: cytochrome bc complex cytochrome b subunit [Chloroflexi bacterium]|nr:cytochrome bc complex cytochrome b subunit [Chloroflexota bacterium]